MRHNIITMIISPLVTVGYVVTQKEITVSPEFLLTLLFNVAVVCVAFGVIQATLRSLRRDVDRLERMLINRHRQQDAED